MLRERLQKEKLISITRFVSFCKAEQGVGEIRICSGARLLYLIRKVAVLIRKNYAQSTEGGIEPAGPGMRKDDSVYRTAARRMIDVHVFQPEEVSVTKVITGTGHVRNSDTGKTLAGSIGSDVINQVLAFNVTIAVSARRKKK